MRIERDKCRGNQRNDGGPTGCYTCVPDSDKRQTSLRLRSSRRLAGALCSMRQFFRRHFMILGNGPVATFEPNCVSQDLHVSSTRLVLSTATLDRPDMCEEISNADLSYAVRRSVRLPMMYCYSVMVALQVRRRLRTAGCCEGQASLGRGNNTLAFSSLEASGLVLVLKCSSFVK